jgi:hypothetical protein
MNKIALQEAIYINSRASSYLLYISKEYKTRIRYIYLNILFKDYTLNITLLVTLGPAKTLL